MVDAKSEWDAEDARNISRVRVDLLQYPISPSQKHGKTILQ